MKKKEVIASVTYFSRLRWS